jgi:peptide/nickel transport system substrate-binding protein
MGATTVLWASRRVGRRLDGAPSAEGATPPSGPAGADGRRGCRPRRAGATTSLLAVAALTLAACATTTSTTSPARKAKPLYGGVAVYSHAVGDDFTWLFPLMNQANYEPWDQNTELMMWRPLYFSGKGTEPVINTTLSLAYPPVWSDHDSVVTVRLKPGYRWSDGTPVTTRDVQFWWDLYKANTSQIATYVPGDLPDNVRSIDWVSPTEFVLHLTGSFNPLWYDLNELTLIVPLPQQAWDRESLGGPVGNYDLTTAGAKAVFSFLLKQSEDLTTYATNPLWKVVDGPWVLTGYDPTTYETTLSRNPSYSGPEKPHLDKVVFITPTSETAEVDGLRSGEIDYGYLPFSDYGLLPYFEHHGFTVEAWRPEYVNFDELGYTGPYRHLVDQLYIRQALQHLVDEPLYMKTVIHGFGQYTYGPVPNIPGSPYVSPQEKVDPYPFSVSAARALLTSHGWRPGPGGYMVCESPGTGTGDCGSGIPRGQVLALKMMYETGYPSLLAQVEYFQTAARSAGIEIQLDPESETTMFSIGGVCPPGPCDWGIIAYSYYLWDYTQNDALPTGGEIFGQGNYWGGGYYSPEAQHLIDLTHTHPGLKYLYEYENYISRQVAGLWFPTQDTRISVVKDTLQGWQQQQAFGNPRPSRWYYVS